MEKTEFKGTKGKWKLLSTYIKKEWVNITSDKDIIARTFYGDAEPMVTKKEAQANALLISKAPEMLEMLNELIHAFEGKNLNGFQEERLSEAKELIKEAINI